MSKCPQPLRAHLRGHLLLGSLCISFPRRLCHPDSRWKQTLSPRSSHRLPPVCSCDADCSLPCVSSSVHMPCHSDSDSNDDQRCSARVLPRSISTQCSPHLCTGDAPLMSEVTTLQLTSNPRDRLDRRGVVLEGRKRSHSFLTWTVQWNPEAPALQFPSLLCTSKPQPRSFHHCPSCPPRPRPGEAGYDEESGRPSLLLYHYEFQHRFQSRVSVCPYFSI